MRVLFKCKKTSRHFCSVNCLNNFWIFQHFIFVVQTKYYILWHFSLVFWQNIIICDILFPRFWWKSNFLCPWVSSISRNLDKKWNVNTSFLLVQRYSRLLHLSMQLDLQIPRLDDLSPACQWPFQNKIIIDYNKIMKSNDFRHLCEDLCSIEISLHCLVKFIVLVFFRC